MKKLILIMAFAPICCFGQKVKGVILYTEEKPPFETKAETGSKVYIVPVKSRPDSYFKFIDTFNSMNYAAKRKFMTESTSGDFKNAAANRQKEKETIDALYGKRIDSLEKEAIDKATVDGAGNYSIEGIPKGKYAILIWSNNCYPKYWYSIKEMKAKETITVDYKFYCK
jgi:hypothetical protein